MSISEEHIKLIEKAWLLSNVKGYPCPLYQVHPRCFMFPNKIMWESHMVQDHSEQELKHPFDLKTFMKEQLAAYDEYIDEQNAIKDEDVPTKIAVDEINERELERSTKTVSTKTLVAENSSEGATTDNINRD